MACLKKETKQHFFPRRIDIAFICVALGIQGVGSTLKTV